MSNWRERLSESVDRMGRRKVAKDAGISLATLNYILRDETSQPTFETVVRITHAAWQNVGWILGEPRYPITEEGRARLRGIINFLEKHFPQLDHDGP
jgi:transcriptional regulator with XRE-family HTH domain